MLPYPTITKLPEQPEPVAVPATWNTRYVEIDANFEHLDHRAEAVESKVESFKSVSGTLTFLNRGVKNGGFMLKSNSATRNLHIRSCDFFMNGRLFNIGSRDNVCAVPSNPTESQGTASVFLFIDDEGLVQCDCTNLNEPAPENSLPIYRLDIPAGNNQTNDPHLEHVDLIGIARRESGWPLLQRNPTTQYIELSEFFLGFCEFSFEVLSPKGGHKESIEVEHKNVMENGVEKRLVFLRLASNTDTVVIRWVARSVNVEVPQ